MHDYQDDDDAFDENGVLKDGKRWRVPMRTLDSLQRAVRDHYAVHRVRLLDAPLHQPGFVRDGCTGAERWSMYDEYDAAVSDAWRNPPRDPPAQAISGRQAGTKDARQAAYAEYEADIANAWRGAGR